MHGMQSEATPGEDEMNPTVKRSGWHPPEDTGLWAIADRIALEVCHLGTTLCIHLKCVNAITSRSVALLTCSTGGLLCCAGLYLRLMCVQQQTVWSARSVHAVTE